MSKRNTKAEIKTALIDLINKKDLEAITVADIAREAKINRGTFYLHYLDKADLVLQLKKEVTDALIEILTIGPPSSITSKREMDLLTHDMSLKALHYLHREQDFINALLSSKGDPSFLRELKDVYRQKVLLTFSDVIDTTIETKLPFVPKDYVEEIILSGMVTVILHWLHKGTIESPETIAHLLLDITFIAPAHSITV